VVRDNYSEISRLSKKLKVYIFKHLKKVARVAKRSGGKSFGVVDNRQRVF